MTCEWGVQMERQVLVRARDAQVRVCSGIRGGDIELCQSTKQRQGQIPATYPSVAPEIKLPQLEGKTPKMYRGGIICTTDHFKPLWSKNSPHFGIAHALALGVCLSFISKRRNKYDN